MNKGYISFLEQNGSELINDKQFKIFRFSSDFGKGSTSIYKLDDYASICFADHIYYHDFLYDIPSDNSISIQQYDSIDSDQIYPNGRVQSGMQYIEKSEENYRYKYKIKKGIPARVMGIQLYPQYYEDYLKRSFDLKNIDLVNKIGKIPKGIYIPEISMILNQIRNFNCSEFSNKLFFKSKVDEAVAVLIQKSEYFEKNDMYISSNDHNNILKILDFINDNLDKSLYLNELAEKTFMSPSKFKYVFKSITKVSLSNYIFNRKMDRACYLLLNSDYMISEIADILGYKSSSSFTNQFKKYTNILPRDYRSVKKR